MSIFDRIKETSYPAEKIFLSSAFRVFLEDATNNICRRYKRKRVSVNVVKTGDSQKTAFTNGSTILINYDFYVIGRIKNKINKFRFLRGFDGHELGHVLFDDFIMLKKIQDFWKMSKIYPLDNHENAISGEQKEAYQEIQKFMKDERYRKQMLDIYLELDNILSDSYVNMQVIKNVPEFAEELKYILMVFKSTLCPFDDLIKQDVPGYQKILLLIHRYVVYNILYSTSEDELAKKVIKLIPLLEKAKSTVHSDTRTTYYQLVFCSIWSEIKESLICQDAKQDKDSSGNNGDKENNADGESDEKEIQKSQEDAKSQGDYISVRPVAGTAPVIQTDAADAVVESVSPIEINGCSSEILSDVLAAISQNENDNSPLPLEVFNFEKESELKDYGENQIVENYDDSDFSERCSRLFESALKVVASEEDYINSAKKNKKELIEFDKSISYPIIHTGLEVYLSRMTHVDNSIKQKYNDFFQREIYPIVNRMVAEIRSLPLNKVQERNGRSYGYYSGKRINFPSTLKPSNYKIFERMNIPQKRKHPQLAFQIVLDMSASMNNDERIAFAKVASLIMLEAAKQLKIPVGVIGHHAECSASNGKKVDVELNLYADCAFPDVNDKYRLMSIQGTGCNRDGYAITYACERLILQKADIKIAFIITDGIPNAKKNNYKGGRAHNDLRHIKDCYEKKGITFLVAAIGDDKKKIKEIYGDGFLDIKSPKNLPGVFKNIFLDIYK